jgi:hypothetical protein
MERTRTRALPTTQTHPWQVGEKGVVRGQEGAGASARRADACLRACLLTCLCEQSVCLLRCRLFVLL